jgi:hypothetical protein
MNSVFNLVQESMMKAIRSARRGEYVSFVGVPHGVKLKGEELFYAHDGPSPSPMIGPRARSATVKLMPRVTKT